MEINHLFSRLGQGFGIIKAMNYASSAITQARTAVAGGILSIAEDRMREQQVLNDLVSYSNDDEWNTVIQLKEQGKIEAAQELANEIRRRHNLM
ncbi:MAG: hypothetical protein SFY80_12145 [Verrucomicrobiota bacterium]|nr:hypothetical protein [Verrucomicrobiota bacterium]